MHHDLKVSQSTDSGGACDDVRDLLYLFVCGELDDQEMETVIRHLSGCEECRTALVEHAQLAKHMGRAMKSIPVEFKSINA